MNKVLKKRLVLTGLCLLFLIPTLSAFYAYYRVDRTVWAMSNKGTLLNPVMPLQELTGEPSTLVSKGQRKWRVLLVAKGKVSHDFNMIMQLRHRLLLLGKEMSRTREVVLARPDEIKKLEKRLALNHVTHVSFVEQQKPMDSPEVFAYLVDPLNNVILSYQKPNNLDAIYSDLKHLLKASNIG